MSWKTSLFRRSRSIAKGYHNPYRSQARDVAARTIQKVFHRRQFTKALRRRRYTKNFKHSPIRWK
jgi:hypothetical protein